MIRANIILAIVAVLLAVPTTLTLWKERSSFTDIAESKLLLAGFTRANVRGVGISVPVYDGKGELAKDEKGELQRKELYVVRTNDGWRLADTNSNLMGPPVQDETVFERIFRHLESIRSDDKSLVLADATNEQLARYGLDDEHAVEIRCVDGAQPSRLLAELMIGKDASAGRVGKDVVRGFYVRTRDSNDVVLYEQDYWLLDPDPKTWVDRNPLRFDVDQATRLEVRSPKGAFAVTRKSADTADWERESGPEDVGAVINSEVRGLLQAIRAVDVQEYRDRVVPGPDFDKLVAERGLDNPSIRIDVTLSGGQRITLAVGRQLPGKNEYWLRVSTLDFLLTAGDWVVTRFDRDPASLFGPSPSRVKEKDH
ncbi:MAG: DUF4340 domain-containing protein [Planctomycetota bacterium]